MPLLFGFLVQNFRKSCHISFPTTSADCLARRYPFSEGDSPQSPKQAPMPTSKIPYWIMLFALAAAVVVYANGLNGPFLFDDHIHISQNQWVKIESLGWADLVRAWNSSFSPFPTNRPLAQLIVRHQPCAGRPQPLGLQGHQSGHPPGDGAVGLRVFPPGSARHRWRGCRRAEE